MTIAWYRTKLEAAAAGFREIEEIAAAMTSQQAGVSMIRAAAAARADEANDKEGL